MDFTRIHLAALVAAVLSATVAAPVSGQQRVPSGNALDANLSVTGGGINALRRSPNFAARNDLITNNVAGGRGFRGSVGYTAAGDFRAPVGADDFFAFRADSAWSDVTFINFGSTYQRLRFGQDVGLLQVDRTYQVPSDQSGLAPAQRVYRPNQLLPAQLRVDRVNTAASLFDDEPTPLFVGSMQRRDEQGEPITDEQGNPTYDIVTSSPLRGLVRQPRGQAPELVGLSLYDIARSREDRTAGRDERPLAQPFSYRFENLRAESGQLEGEPIDARSAPDRVETKIAADVEDEYREILARIAEREAAREAEAEADARATEDEGDSLSALDRTFGDLREYLAGVERPEIDRPGVEQPKPPMPSPDLPGIDLDGTTDEGETDSDETDSGTVDLADIDPYAAEEAREAEKINDLMRDFTVEELAAMLRHGKRIDALASDEQSRFNELMREGESDLKAGEYFRAERRFIRALRFTPGHPLATAGLAHAQLGSGAYHSAALTLRSLFTYQPEMIDARYDEAIKPNRPRLVTAVETLETRLKREQTRLETAFLLAYVGRLLGDRDLVARALDAVEAAAPEDRLLPLLRSIWLAEEGDAASGSADAAPSEKGSTEAAPATPEK